MVNQLKENGIIVAPIGNIFEQSLTAFKKIKGKIKIKKEIPGFMFVPLVEGWNYVLFPLHFVFCTLKLRKSYLSLSCLWCGPKIIAAGNSL